MKRNLLTVLDKGEAEDEKLLVYNVLGWPEEIPNQVRIAAD